MTLNVVSLYEAGRLPSATDTCLPGSITTMRFRVSFKLTRAEVCDPRVHPPHVRHIENVLACAYARLHDAAWQAYRSNPNRIIYFYYMLREFLSEVDQHCPDSGKLKGIMDAAEIARRSRERFETVRKEKENAALQPDRRKAR